MDFQVNDVVQVTDPKHRWFPSLMIVSETDKQTSSGRLMCYCLMPNNDGNQASKMYIFLKTTEVEKIGQAIIASR